MSSKNNEMEWRNRVREGIVAGAEWNKCFVFMNILAATIASYGLFANSPAIIIGAMIVAVLIGAVAGTALSLEEGNKRLLLHSLRSLFAGTILVVSIGYVLSRLRFDIPISAEIMASTSPNLID